MAGHASVGMQLDRFQEADTFKAQLAEWLDHLGTLDSSRGAAAEAGSEAPGTSTDEATATSALMNDLPLLVGAGASGPAPPAELQLLARMEETLNRYQEQPHLLNNHLDDIVKALLDFVRQARTCAVPGVHLVFKLLYVICKVRGPKAMTRRFSHQVEDLHLIMLLIAEQRPDEHDVWTTRYVLLLWLSLVVLLPFDIAVLDASGALPHRIFSLCQQYLGVADTARDAAALLTARFVTRPDMVASHLPKFVDWGLENLTASHAGGNALLQTGILAALARVFKIGQRSHLLPYTGQVLENDGFVALLDSPHIVVRKLVMKLIQRVGMCLLPPRVAAWRYQRGNRILAQNLQSAGVQVPSAQPPASPADDNSKGHDANGDDDEDDDDAYDVPDEMEEIIEYLLNGLKDTDTIVRWSSAKGLGRVTNRLPKELADEVVESILELFSLQHSDAAWHGGCLTLAELARRGLLLPERLPDIMPLVRRALVYDVFVGVNSVGAHVRDAACYVCWAFARAYAPAVLHDYTDAQAASLLTAALYDRESNVRRAAAAALQENVGRLGTIPHGIALIGKIDFFAVGNRRATCTTLTAFVAQFPEYQAALVEHVAEVKLCHWDPAIRAGAATALRKLAQQCPELVRARLDGTVLTRTASLDLNTRHGALLGLGQALVGLAREAAGQTEREDFETEIEDEGEGVERAADVVVEPDAGVLPELPAYDLPPELGLRVREIVADYTDKGYFRGLSGTYLRHAMCTCLRDLAHAHVSLPSEVVQAWLTFSVDNLVVSDERVQTAGLECFLALTRRYVHAATTTSGLRDWFNAEVVPRLRGYLATSDGNRVAGGGGSAPVYTRLGPAQALGALDWTLLSDVDATIAALVGAATVADGVESLAPARAAAVTAITTALVCSDHRAVLAMALRLRRLLAPVLVGLDDYAVDSRGDIGSLVRRAAITGLGQFVPMWMSATVPAPVAAVVEEALVQGLGKVLRQTVEKIDRVRMLALDTLQSLLQACVVSPRSVDTAAWAALREAVHSIQQVREAHADHLVEEDTVSTYRELVGLLDHAVWRRELLLGLCVTIGGLTESLIRDATVSLVGYFDARVGTPEGEAQAAAVLQELVSTARTFEVADSRLVFAWLDTVLCVLNNGCCDQWLAETSGGPATTVLPDIYALVKGWAQGSSNPKLLLRVVRVLGALLPFAASTEDAVRTLGFFLCHRFPKVRRVSAEVFYLGLQNLPDALARMPDVLRGQLLATAWDDAPIEDVRALRNLLLLHFGLPPPKTKARTATSKSGQEPKPPTNELNSYRDLVERAGY